MTHAVFAPDGASLLFADVFGVTRVAFGKAVKVKHTAKVTAAVGDLSVNAAGDLALVHGRVHTGAYGNHGLATLALPGLGLRDKISASYDRRALATTAAGDRVVALTHRGLEVQVIEGGVLRIERTIDLAAKAARALDARRVGPQAEGFPSDGLHVAPDGRFVARDHRAVYAGRVGADDASDAVWWSLPLAVHCAAEVTLAAVGDESWVFVRDVTEDVVRALVVGRDGAARELSFASLCAPAVDADALLTQPDSHTVVARAHADGRERRYDVRAFNEHPAAAPEPSAYPHGEPPAPTRLPGSLAARGERHVFVPWHRESVVDLARNTSHSRGLDAAPGPFRRLLLERYAHLNESLRALGFEAQLLAFERHPKDPRVSLSAWTPPLPPTLASALGQDHARSLWERFELATHGHRWSSFGQEGGHLPATARASPAEVRGALAWMRAHDVLPVDVAAVVARSYADGMGIPSAPREDAFLFDGEGERLFLRAALETLAAGRWPADAPLDAWGHEPVTAAHAQAAADGLAKLARPLHREALDVVARMLARHLGASSLPALAALLRATAARRVQYDGVRRVGEAMTWAVHHHPALRDEALAVVDECIAADTRENSNVTHDLGLTRERVARGARHFWSNA